jgi:hypothetical protein
MFVSRKSRVGLKAASRQLTTSLFKKPRTKAVYSGEVKIEGAVESYENPAG